MKRKVISMLLIASMAAALAVGCGGKEESGDAAGGTAGDTAGEENQGNEEQGGGSITFMAPDWAIPTDDQLKAFTDETGIEVVVNEVGWDDIRDKLVTAAAGGQAVADVVEVDWSWVGEFYAADWLEPLEVSDEVKKDMPTLETFTKEGNVLAIPYANDYRLSYYNTKQYEDAGISAEPQTWDEVYQNCKTLKEKGVCDYPFALPLNAEEKTSTYLMWLAYTMNGVVFNDDGTLNKDSVLAALKYEENLIKDELVDPADKTSSGMDAYKRILSGSANFLTGPTSFVSKSTNEDDCSVIGEITPILVPGKDAKATVTMALPEALGVTKFSENKEEAKKFIEWYTSADMQEKLNETNTAIPTRNSVLKKLIDDGKIQNAGAMMEEAELIASPFPDGIPAYYSEMSNSIYNAINKMALGEMTADEAYAEMEAKVAELAAE
ncbi:MAG: extracellular solute-binding protein [Dorea sp.]|nr:extracellular solute-binding protein [Dorea sp.]